MKRIALILSLVLTACRGSVVTAPVIQDGLPPVPAFVDAPLGPVAVVVVDSIPTNQPGYIILGQFSPLDRVIYRWRRITSRTEQWRVTLHEQCHANAWDRGLRSQDEREEVLCDAWAHERIVAMRKP